ncbi:MAG: pilus assembly protein [bacterium]|nr:pilus assembly protein [bacterium]
MAEFVMVGALVILIFVALIQLSLALYVRNILMDSAAEGARHGAVAGAGPEDAANRTRYLISLALPEHFASGVSAREVSRDGIRAVRVEVRAHLPVVALTGVGPALTLSAHAIDEDGLP